MTTDFRFPISDFRFEEATALRARSVFQSAIGNRKSAITAFTLTELLVVIGLIVLLLVMAVPAFNLISGSGSIDQAQNQIAAMFSQAQATAIDRQNYVGVLFYKDLGSDRTALVLVEKVKPKPWIPLRPDTTTGTNVGMNYRRGDIVSRVTTIASEPTGMEGEPLGTMVRYYIANQDHVASPGNGPTAEGGMSQQWSMIKPYMLDLVRDAGDAPGEPPRFRESQRLPKNVQVQFPFEPQRWATGTKYYREQRIVEGGAVYACRSEHISNSIVSGAGANRPPNGTYWVTDPTIETYMGVGVVMFDPNGRPAFDTRAGYSVQARSQLGELLGVTDTQPFPFFYGRTDFVMFDQEAFRGAGWNDVDPMIDGQANAAEVQEEKWLDENATLLLVHKYRGTLGRAE